MRYIFVVFLMMFVISFSEGSALAQTAPASGAGPTAPQVGVGPTAPAPAPASAPSGSASLSNPLDSSISSIPAFFGVLVDIILVFAIPFIVFFIIYAGFLYVTAQGNPEKIQKAHSALLYALIGGMLILGANVLLYVITNTVTQII